MTMTAGSEVEQYDLVVLGSGEGSKFLAWTLARQGQRVAVVEHKWIGGSCPNIACLPSKNMIHSAKVTSYFARAEEFGIETAGYAANMGKVVNRKRKMVRELVDIHVRNFETGGAHLIFGHGSFTGPTTVRVDFPDGSTRQLRGKNIVIGTGTRANLDAIPGLADARPLTHIEALELDEIPARLLIPGGGYIGLEFAQAMRRLGSSVTILERNPTLLHHEDQDVVSELETLFCEEGIEVILNVTLDTVSGLSGEAISLTYHHQGESRTVQGSHLLVAAGRTPNTQGLGLEHAGVELTKNGFIKVDERLQTSVTGVWANGDVAGGPQFTHMAFDDFRILRDNLAGGNRVTTGRLVPYSMFTDPELARVGLSEREARVAGISYRLFRIPMLPCCGHAHSQRHGAL